MRDIEARWRNAAPRNPVQTAYLRFLRGPGGEIRTAFSDSTDAFAAYTAPSNSLLKTPYDELLWDWTRGEK